MTVRTAAAAFASVLLGLTGPLHADLIIRQQVEGSQAGEMTIQIRDGKSRSDLAQPVSMITDAATGDTVVLQHARKRFIRMPATQTKALAEQLLKSQASATPKLQATGQKQAIGGYECELYTWTLGAMKMKFWVARDYPGAESVQRQLDQMQNTGLAATAASLMPKANELPGVRLRTEVEVGSQKVTYTITSITDAPIDPGVFEIPKGYTETPMSLGTALPE